MSLESGASLPGTQFLTALVQPAVLADLAGIVLGWNDAAAARLTVPAAEAKGRWSGDVLVGLESAFRLDLGADAAGRILFVWPSTTAANDAETVALQKADLLGRLAGSISHDLVNPLGAILTFASMLGAEPGVPPDLQASAGMLRDEADRTLRLVRSLLDLTRNRPPVRTHVAVGPMVRECLDLLGSGVGQLDVQVNVSDVMPEVEADPAHLRQAVLALMIHAVEAMGGTWLRGGSRASGRLRIAAQLMEEAGGYKVQVSVEDTGPAPTTAKPAGRDLSVAAMLVEEAGGRTLYERLPDGNRVVIQLPLAGDPALVPAPGKPGPLADPRTVPRSAAPTSLVLASTAATGSPGAPAAGAAGPPVSVTGPAGRTALTVLVCDDETSIRALLVRVVLRNGHQAREASGGIEALALLDAERMDLVIADQRMADMTGVDLYRQAVDRRPELATRFVLMSGDAGTPELVEFAATTGLQVIEKPFDLGVVTATLKRLAGG